MGVFINKKHYKNIIRFQEILYNILLNQNIDEKEYEKLKKYVRKYKIPKKYQQKYFRDAFLSVLFKKSDDLIITEEEQNQLEDLMNKLNIDVETREFARLYQNKINEIKNIMNGNLPDIIPPSFFIPRKNEKVFFCEESSLFETIKENIRVGTSFGIGKLLPGGSFINPRLYLSKNIAYEKLKYIDDGLLIITNKRIVFISPSRNKEIPLSKIIGIEGAAEGIQIHRVKKVRKEIFKLGIFKAQIAIAILNVLLRNEEI